MYMNNFMYVYYRLYKPASWNYKTNNTWILKSRKKVNNGYHYEDYFEGDGEEELEFIEYLKNKLDILEENGFIERYKLKKLI